MNVTIKNITKKLPIVNLLRVKQWIKNFFVLIPFFISLKFINFNLKDYFDAFFAFVNFCLIASSVYIINEIKDIEEDKNHPKKKQRPIASGQISKTAGLLISLFILALSILVSLSVFNVLAFCVIISYFVLNIIYTFKAKHYAIFDCFFIAVFFVLRVVFGIVCFDIVLSKWILLLTFCLCLFLAFSKRRKELGVEGYKRQALNGYTLSLLDKFITISASLAIASYVMYTTEMTNITGGMFFMISNIFVFFGIFRYLQVIHLNKVDTGEPGSVIYKDYVFLANLFLWGITLFLGLTSKIYFFNL